MARSPRLTGDPERARTHPAGSTVAFIQPLAHARFGALGYVWLPPDRNRMRLLDAEDGGLAYRVYETGSRLVNHAMRTVQQFCVEVERIKDRCLLGSTMEDRLKEAAAHAELPLDPTAAWYQRLSEMSAIRDALEHPTQKRVYNIDDWDTVPLAWFLSDRSVSASESARAGLEPLINAWEDWVATNKRPGQMVASERGVHSRLQFKKPPAGQLNDL